MALRVTPALDERLTPRARAYLAITAATQTALALVCVLVPQTFSSSSYQGIRTALPGVHPTHALIVWGGLFGVGAALATWSVVRATEHAARCALLASVVTTGLWLGGFIAAALTGELAGPTGPIVWSALLLKDATMLRSPLRNPFEPLLRRLSRG